MFTPELRRGSARVPPPCLGSAALSSHVFDFRLFVFERFPPLRNVRDGQRRDSSSFSPLAFSFFLFLDTEARQRTGTLAPNPPLSVYFSISLHAIPARRRGSAPVPWPRIPHYRVYFSVSSSCTRFRHGGAALTLSQFSNRPSCAWMMCPHANPLLSNPPLEMQTHLVCHLPARSPRSQRTRFRSRAFQIQKENRIALSQNPPPNPPRAIRRRPKPPSATSLGMRGKIQQNDSRSPWPKTSGKTPGAHPLNAG